MPQFAELLILLPCHSLEDFPTYHEGDDSQSLLANWSALWHPELLASAGVAPEWKRIEDPPQELPNRLIAVPTVCVQRLPTGYAQRVKEAGGLLIRGKTSRQEIVDAALAFLGPRTNAVSEDLAADFLALGYGYLQVTLLTRQMRYSSNLDETYFKSTAVAAAKAAVEGDEALAREKLGACFSLLAEERDHYYPVDALVVEIKLMASSTIGGPLRDDLRGSTPTNLLVSGELLEEMASKEPASLDLIRERSLAGNLGIMGGERTERRLPLLSLDDIAAGLVAGKETYEQHLGKSPEVYGRWKFGLTPQLPGILNRLGYKGALHTSLEDGKVPDGTQLKVRWEGLDGQAIDAIARPPLDASKPNTFVTYATKLGESMDGDHVATVCLAHWPGQACCWLDDLHRIAKYCSALGKFVTVEHYFRETAQPGHVDRFEADRYKSPYLKQAVIRRQDDPISTSVRYWQQQAIEATAGTLDALASAVSGAANDAHNAINDTSNEADCTAGSIDSAKASRDQAAQRLSDKLAGTSRAAGRGVLVVNPHSFVRRECVEVKDFAALPPIEKPVYAVGGSAAAGQVVVDIPPLGFVWIPAESKPAKDTKQPLLAEEGLLRNEFFEAHINAVTGTLSSLHEYGKRGNRLSQQLALRLPGAAQKPGDTYRDPDETAIYSAMAADSVEVTQATTAVGEITCKGRLLDREGKKLAGFVQKYRVTRGSRVLQVQVELDPIEQPRADPWNSYYCARFAWADPTAEVFRTLHQTRVPFGGKQFEAPHYIDLVTPKDNTTILTGGLPFHRRHDERMLDSLLITRHERERQFTFGIGLDVKYPLTEALALLSGPVTVDRAPAPHSGTTGWLAHVDAKNVLITSLQPLVESNKVVGFAMKLLETEGRPAKAALRTFRSLASGQVVDAAGATLRELTMEEGKVRVDLTPHEWVWLRARFQSP
jgi:alpha-mannosidase